MSIVLDLIVIAIILLSIIISAKKGFVSVLVETVGIIVAFSLALTLSTPLANLTYDKIIEPAVVSTIESNIQNAAEVTSEHISSAIPKNIINAASAFGLSVEEIINELPSNTVDAKAVAEKISVDVVKPVAVKIAELAFTLLIFCLLSVVVKLSSKVLKKLFSFSIVGKLNRNLGGIIGGVRGIILATIFCVAVTFIVSLMGNGFWIFTLDNINNTFIFKGLSGVTDIFNI